MEKKILRRRQSARWKDVLVPLADKYIKNISNNLKGWHVRRLDNVTAEVQLMEKREISEYGRKNIQLHEMSTS